MSDNTMSSEAYMETETWQACTEEALRAEIRTPETELRDTGKILERLDKPVSLPRACLSRLKSCGNDYRGWRNSCGNCRLILSLSKLSLQ